MLISRYSSWEYQLHPWVICFRFQQDYRDCFPLPSWSNLFVDLCFFWVKMMARPPISGWWTAESTKQENFLNKIPVPVEVLLAGRYLYFYNPRWPFNDWHRWLCSLPSSASRVKVSGHNQSNKTGWKTIRLPLTAHYIRLTLLSTQNCHS